jgi:threonyl-tRNA synthetase
MADDKKDFPIMTQRHSRAHLLAQAVQRYVDPQAQLGTGPRTQSGCYYDIMLSDSVEFGEKDLKKMTKLVKQVAKEPQTFIRFACPIDDGYEINNLTNQTFKNELLDKFKAAGETEISYYLNVVPLAVVEHLRGAQEGYTSMYGSVSAFFRSNGTIDSDQAVTFLDLCAGPHVELTKEDLDTN